MDVYSTESKLLCLFFTNNSHIITLVLQSKCHVFADFQRNMYGLPMISSLFSKASQFNGKYYGYINSDVIDPELFNVLSFLQKEMERGSISRKHELTGRVYQTPKEYVLWTFSNSSSISRYVSAFSKQYQALQGRSSAVRHFSVCYA